MTFLRGSKFAATKEFKHLFMSSLTPALTPETDNNSLTVAKNHSLLAFNGRSLLLKFAGVLIFLGLWYLGGEWVANNPDTQNFADFAPEPALKAFSDLVTSGSLFENSLPSLKRIFLGIIIALAIGIPLGVAIGRFS